MESPLWIGLHAPLLSLETVAGALLPDVPLALHDAQQITHANAAAQAMGVHAGLKRATALALAPSLLLTQADPARDARALQALAHAALAFTPSVSLAPPQTVLLEVRASLRYFGGFERLWQRLGEALVPLGHRLWMSSAPTAQGAALLCRLAGLQGSEAAVAATNDRTSPPPTPPTPPTPHGLGAALHCPDLVSLTHRLDAAPVWLLGPGREHWEALQGMGLRRLGDLRRLPRGGVARRFGESLLAELDAALGQRPDPRPWVTLPERFRSRLELLARADTTDQVLHGARVLLARLVAWAAAQQSRIGRFELVMHHEARHRSDLLTPPATELAVALTEPSADADHLHVLLRERLAQVRLPAPTLELQLRCDEAVHKPPPNAELFPTRQNEREGLVRLIERLRARLGGDQVQRLVQLEDHRPERASRCLPLDDRWPAAPRTTVTPPSTVPQRQQPVWLLPQPEPLAERQLCPLLDGEPLHLLCGPERIESGWWDAGLVERDYFIAQAADGALVWVYRTRLPPADASHPVWFLHGRFA